MDRWDEELYTEANIAAYQALVDRAIREGGLPRKEISSSLTALTGWPLSGIPGKDVTGLRWIRFPNHMYCPEYQHV